jgi:hypothetical protein
VFELRPAHWGERLPVAHLMPSMLIERALRSTQGPGTEPAVATVDTATVVVAVRAMPAGDDWSIASVPDGEVKAATVVDRRQGRLLVCG